LVGDELQVRTFTVINQKGGCGKTTSAINLAAAFAKAGCRTLLVDLDPQSHCAAGLGVPEDRLDQDVSDALRAPVDQKLNRDRLIWHVGRNLDLLPSRMKLAGIEAAQGGLADQENKALRLRSVLARLSRDDARSTSIEPEDKQFEDDQMGGVADELSEQLKQSSNHQLYGQARRYDVCLIDCPPSIGLLSYNAIAAGREVIIPVETSFFSLRGAAKQVQTARSIARRIGMRTHPRLLATMHDPSQPLARDLLDDLRDRFGAGMIPVVVRYDHALKEAASFGQSIEEYDPESMGAEDYRSVCEWLVEHVNIDRQEPEVLATNERMGGRGVQGAPTLAQVSVEPKGGGGLSRAQELAMRARTMQQSQLSTKAETQNQTAPLETVAGQAVLDDGADAIGCEQKTVSIPVKRSLMPHRPVAIELVVDSDPSVEQVSTASHADVTRVKHLFGIRKSSTGVLFVQPMSVGRRIEIAGDFNDWDPTLGVMTRNEAIGVFEKHIKLPAGEYEYKLVIDGQWCLDPHNPEFTKNGMGGRNNLIRVE
jgi:chromosome partitioning protein